MRSLSWPRAVSMTIGTGARARSRRQTSRPSMPGSIRSSTTRSGGSASARSSATRPSATVSTVKPSRSQVAATTSAPWRRRPRPGSVRGAIVPLPSVRPRTGADPLTKRRNNCRLPAGAAGRSAVHRPRGHHRARQGTGPRPGQDPAVPAVPPAEAAAVAEAALADTLAAACASGADRVVLALDGRPGAWCPPGVGWSARARAARRPAGRGLVARAGPALQIGMDTPQLTRRRPGPGHGGACPPRASTPCWARPPTAAGGPSGCGGRTRWRSWACRRAGPTRARARRPGSPTLGLRTRLLARRRDVDTWPDARGGRRRRRRGTAFAAACVRRAGRRDGAAGHDAVTAVTAGRRGHRPGRRPLAGAARRRRAGAAGAAGRPGPRRRLRARAHRRGSGGRRAAGAGHRHQSRRGRRGPAAAGAGAAPLGVRPAAGRGPMGLGAAARRQRRHRRRPAGAAAPVRGAGPPGRPGGRRGGRARHAVRAGHRAPRAGRPDRGVVPVGPGGGRRGPPGGRQPRACDVAAVSPPRAAGGSSWMRHT